MTDIKLTWNNRTTDAVSQKIYRSLEKFDSSNLPTVHAEVAFWIKEYLDEDVTEDAYWYMLSTVTEDDELFSDCVRIEKGEAGECDPHWDKVVALLHFDGDFTDETGGVVTTDGDLSFTPGKFSEAVRFTRSADPRTLIRKSGLNIGTGDFTVEAWVRLSSLSLNNTIFDFRLGRGNSPLPLVESDGGNLYAWVIGSYLIGPVASVMSASQFQHLALVRSSGVLSLWLDGVPVGTAQYTHDMGIAQLTIGRSMNTGDSGTSYDLAGDIDELRITKGVARYTENFTPPTNPFPNC